MPNPMSAKGGEVGVINFGRPGRPNVEGRFDGGGTIPFLEETPASQQLGPSGVTRWFTSNQPGADRGTLCRSSVVVGIASVSFTSTPISCAGLSSWSFWYPLKQGGV